jgi:AraC family transcriptional regulator
VFVARRLDAFPAAPGSVVLTCDCAAGSGGPDSTGLSIRSMRRGTEEIRLERRRVAVDEDAYLIVNAGHGTRSRYLADGTARPFAVFFDGGLLADALAAAGDLLDAGAPGGLHGGGGFAFLEHLRPWGDALGRRLRRFEQAMAGGDEDSLEEQLALLLHAALDSERGLRRRAERIDCVKPATRAELLRRVLLAADFMLSHYEQPIRLEHIAAAARLSRYHLVRLFHRTHGVTPREYLLAKRLAVAARLLRETRFELSEIAARTGFGTRCSLFRHLQRRLGASGRGLRAGSAPDVPARRRSIASACRIAA